MAHESPVSKPPWLFMGNFIVFGLLLLIDCHVVLANSARNGTLQKSTCNQRDCLRCDLDTAECVKCLYVLMADTRVCRSACPPGYSTTWAPLPEEGSYAPKNAVMGRICSEQSMLALVSGRDVGIIAGAAVAGAICVGVVIGALLYMRKRTKPMPDHHRHDHPRHAPPRLWKDKRPKATEVSVAEEERTEFLQQLRNLRGEANNFLEMLSETRNRFRRLGGPDSATDTKAKAYRAVVRDLSRVLTLLNRKEEHIVTVPGDWRRLLSWASRVLTRYKRQKAAKEAGDITTLEPLSTGGGTLYQTRKQAQAERCRLVALGAPCSTFNNHRTYGSDGPPTPCRETPPASLISSRSVSMVSLTPMILEEEDDEAPENPEDILFDSTLDTTPPSIKKSETHENLHMDVTDKSDFEPQYKKNDSTFNDFMKKDLHVIDIKEKDNIPSVHLTSVNDKKDHDKFNKSHLESELEKRGIPMISQNELLRGFKYVKENNNNIKKINGINELCSIISDGYITRPSVIESLKNLKNIEHLNNNAKNTPSPYLKMESKILREPQYENHKFANDIHQKEKDIKTDHSKVQISPKDQKNIQVKTTVGNNRTIPISTHLKSIAKDQSMPKSDSPIKHQKQDDKVTAALPGEDVYITIIRKPVLTNLLLSGDPYRDDTIEKSQEFEGKILPKTKSNVISPVSCKAQISRHLSTPRCELTTEL